MKKSRSKHKVLPASSRILPSVATLAEGIADDFNNILTTVMGACSIIDRDDSANAELRQSVALIRSSAERAAALSDKLVHSGVSENEGISSPIDKTSERDKISDDGIVSPNKTSEGV